MILIGGKARFLFSLPFPPSSNIWNDMQWYSYSCKPWIGIGGIRLEWICVVCWICVGYVWDTFGMDMCGMLDMCGICVGYVWNGYVWDMCGMLDMCGICVGYVWCAGYVWDMCGVLDMCGICVGYVWNGHVWDMCGVLDMCGICVGYVWNGYVWDMCGVLDMCGICVVWDTPTIFWRTLRRNVFREKGELPQNYRTFASSLINPQMDFIWWPPCKTSFSDFPFLKKSHLRCKRGILVASEYHLILDVWKRWSIKNHLWCWLSSFILKYNMLIRLDICQNIGEYHRSWCLLYHIWGGFRKVNFGDFGEEMTMWVGDD